MIAESEQRLLKERIVEQAARFELPALMDALEALGYLSEEVLFRSHPSLSHSASLVRSVAFQESPRRAIVECNVGLLSTQGPLPMYFWELLSEQRDLGLTQMLWFFDQELLAQRFGSLYPERDARRMPGWEATRKRLLLLARLSSPSGVHWLLSQCFPEFELQVRRTRGERLLRTEEFDVGGARMGAGCTLGGIGKLPVSGVEALLVFREEDSCGEAIWIERVQERLCRLVLPVLFDQDPYLYLRVYLILRQAVGHLRLVRDRYVGINRIDRALSLRPPAEVLLLWSGEVRHALLSDHLNFHLSSHEESITQGGASFSNAAASKEDHHGHSR